ncbi:hypothetical protein H5410_050118 [Solanum commersonii]|uniref:Uncharacterized protein n=1 Tax=Solanum commersonii TaxID=4109 RepID=A0A9J5WUG2_SOLCO|nr:hypothetical protein H5410_050118 [Solanum commersonii]
MAEFSSCIEELELLDPLLFGGSFTWRRGDNHRIASRIERFLHYLWKLGAEKNHIVNLKHGRWKLRDSERGRPGYVLADKLKMLKGKLNEWSKNNRGNLKKRKEGILNQFSSWEAIQEQRNLSNDELL